MRLTLPVTLALALLGTAPSAALTPHLVKDINTVPQSSGSAPQGYVTVGNVAFFSAIAVDSGRELWRTDGTTAGTFQIADACPGECSGEPRTVAQNGGSYFFTAKAVEGFSEELWVTRGSPANTFRLTGPLRFPSVREGIWYAWVASQGVLYFTADDGIHGRELWRTDGTPAGTVMAVDVRPGPLGSNLGDLIDFNGRLFFRADDGQRGPSLWKSDGTAAGTQPVRDPVPSSASHGGPVFLNVVGRTLFFVAPAGNRGSQLWKSDGTTRGTASLTNARFSAATPFYDFSALGNRLLFVASDSAKGQELWASDGTPGGTRTLTSLPRTDAFLNLADFRDYRLPRRPLGPRLIFRTDDGRHGAELWTTDGTPKGTRLLRDLCPGSCSGAVTDAYVSGSVAFFSRWGGASEQVEPWVTDGTATGTRFIRDVCGAPCRLGPSAWNVGGGKAFFLMPASSSGFRPQLWRTDGTAQGTFLLTDASVPDVPNFLPFAGTFVGGKFLYTASETSSGAEPWASDGTPQGTRLVADINLLEIGGSSPYNLRPAGDKVYFLADDGEHGPGTLWVSDGTAAGTRFVYDLFPGSDPFNPLTFVASAAAGGRFYFTTVVLGGGGTYALWSTDGTTAGTGKILPENIRVSGYDLAALGDKVFFSAFDPFWGQALWVTDGTPAGTRMLAGLQIRALPSIAAFQGRVYFAGCELETGCELWSTDGTPGGTALVKDIDPRTFTGTGPRLLTEHAGKLFFVTPDDQHAARIWSTDGTAAGTLPLDLIPGPDELLPSFMISAGSRFFVWGSSVAANGAPNPEVGLWVSDGTAAGTHHLNDGLINDPSQAGVLNGDVYFSRASDGFLWKSDGTEAGTTQVFSRQGNRIRFAVNFRVLGGRLAFTTYNQGWLFETDGTQNGTVKLLQLGGPGFTSAVFDLVPAGPRLLLRSWDRDNGAELWALEAE